MSQDPQPTNEAEALRLVIEGTASETGTEFFRALVKNLATALGTAGAWVTEYLPEEKKLRALAMWLNGKHVEHYEYCLKDTPCAPVVENRSLVHIPDRIVELFPGDNDLQPMSAVSYMGVPLFDTDGAVMGHLSVLDTKPMPRDERMVSLFEIFAARAQAEHRRLKVEREVRAREEQLSALLATAMDAILVLDARLKVARINHAAARLFGCTEEDIIGENIHDFLVKESAARVETFTRELETRPDGKQQLWVPQDFVARRWDHSVFPAEATLSRFENQGQTFYTLILRNVDERIEAEKQIQLLTQEAEYLREAVRDMPGHGDLIGRSDCMRTVFDAVKQVARTDSTVLVTGETGTGKELVARAIHRASHRAEKALVLVNCAAIPANLIESEFFGHERGAFTGAVTRREGRFSLANGGTIFLDEIGELPLELQAKLLRVLQEGEFEPLGSAKTVKVSVRVVAATNRDLKQMSAKGKFREDLYFRLHVFPIHIPALRERGKDVELLADAFAKRFARRMGKRIHPLYDAQLRLLRSYDWPGNVRELQNVIERAIILSTDPRLQLERAMGNVTAPKTPAPAGPSEASDRVLTAKEMLDLERANLVRALESCDWKISGETGAARLLGIPASTLSSRMKALQIQKGSHRVTMRTLAIGDIHGNLAALDALIAAVNAQEDDLLVFLGDYIDRGPDSKGVVSRLIELSLRHLVLPLRGNHEVMILAARTDPLQANLWRSYGGDEALASVGAEYREDWQECVPAEHWKFFESTHPWLETDTHIFVHGSVLPNLDMDDQPEYTLYWERFDPALRHKSGKIIVCGHTPQRSGWPSRGEFNVCIDTGAGHGLWLTCLDVFSGEFWQANEQCELRTGKL